MRHLIQEFRHLYLGYLPKGQEFSEKAGQKLQDVPGSF
jgi:hypothetical protein